MKKLFLLALCVTASYLGLNAQDATASQDGPIMTFETMIVEYGKIEQGSDRVRYAKFKNTGNQPLIINDCKGSCGCTVPKCPKGKPIMPGEEGEIKIEYDTKRIGNISKTVTVKSNATNSPIYLRIKGNISAAQAAFPKNSGTTTPAANTK